MAELPPQVPTYEPAAQSHGHVYAWVRRDLPLADQIVQIGHVCLEAGLRFCIPRGCSLVLLQVQDEPGLQRVLEHCRRHGIPVHTFWEPDAIDAAYPTPMGLTTACTPPLDATQRKYLRRFPLWKAAEQEAGRSLDCEA